MACRTGCRTGGHKSWGECARAAHIAVQRLDGQYDRAFDRETERYFQAVKDGLDPEGVETAAVDRAYAARDFAESKIGAEIVEAIATEG